MNWNGIVIGIISFIIIGIFHPIVIKCEYYFTQKIWPVFLIAGVGLLVLSLFIDSVIISSAIGVTGFTCLWSIGELKEQRERVAKGWFPANPKNHPISKKENNLT